MKLSLNALYPALLQDLEPFLPTRFYDTACQKNGKPTVEVDLSSEIESGLLSDREFASLALLDSIFKKYKDSVSDSANDLAFSKFDAANSQCRTWELRCESLLDEHLIGEFRDSLYRFFIPSSSGSLLSTPDQFFELGGLGPGASVGSRGTDFYTKLFDGPLTCTSNGLYKLYLNYIKGSPSLIEAESARHERYGDPHIVAGSKLSFVPKNDSISRVICTEPVLNMWAQKGVGEVITRRLKKHFGINLSTQPDINRELARIGSINNRLSTIDLASASDSISLTMLRDLLPTPVMEVLEVLRSPMTEVNPRDFDKPYMFGLDEDKSCQLDLDMVSSMGNGFTFPLQTALFACAVEAVYKVFEKKLKKSDLPRGRFGNFGVFGDDIICKSDVAHHVIRLLELLGFTTNASKSFVVGPFRESCGGDFYKGFPVRGVYIKDLRSMASRYVAINRLNLWTATTGISLSRTMSKLMKSVRLLPVPLHENDDAGIKVSSRVLKDIIALDKSIDKSDWTHDSDPPLLFETGDADPKHPGGSFNASLLDECATPAEAVSKINSYQREFQWELKSIARSQDTGAWLYRRYVAKPYKVTFLEDAILVPKGARRRYFNAEGAFNAFLHGNIEGGTVSIRHGRVRYLTNTARTPCWDFVPATGSKEPVDHRRWDSALWLNLMI